MLYTGTCILHNAMNHTYFENLGNEYLAHFSRRLSDLIIEQATTILQEAEIITPATAISSILFLANEENATVATLADALDVSHQMATQRINALEKLALLKRIDNENDKRAKKIVLTALGNQEAAKLLPLTKQLKHAFNNLEKELACDLAKVIRSAEKALITQPLKDRAKDI